MEREAKSDAADFVTLVLIGSGSPEDGSPTFVCQRSSLQNSASPYLQQLVSGAWSEGQHSRINIRYECSAENFENVLRFAFGYRSKDRAYDHLHISIPQEDSRYQDVEEQEEREDAAVECKDEVDVEMEWHNLSISSSQKADWALLAHEEDQERLHKERKTVTYDRHPNSEERPEGDLLEDDVLVEKIITRENALSLYEDAQFFQLPELALECETFIARHIVGYHNVCHYWTASVQSSMHVLERHCRAIFMDHFEKVIKQEDFVLLPHDLLVDAIKSPYLKVKSENSVWSAVLRWATHQHQQGQTHDPENGQDITDIKGKKKAEASSKLARTANQDTRPSSETGRWERGMAPGAQNEKVSKGGKAALHDQYGALKEFMHDLIPYIRYPLMDFKFLCEQVAPTGLVPHEFLDEAYTFLLYKANGLTGYSQNPNSRSVRTFARRPKLKMSDVYAATATGGPVRSANLEIITEVYRWLFNTRPHDSSLTALQHSINHFLKSKSVGRTFRWIDEQLIVTELQRIGFVKVTPPWPGVLTYRIERDEHLSVSLESRALSIILEDIVLWLRDHPSRPNHLGPLERQVSYYLRHKKLGNIFLVDAETIVHLLLQTNRVKTRAEKQRNQSRTQASYEDRQQREVELNPQVDTTFRCGQCHNAYTLCSSTLKWYFVRRFKLPTSCQMCRTKSKEPSPDANSASLFYTTENLRASGRGTFRRN